MQVLGGASVKSLLAAVCLFCCVSGFTSIVYAEVEPDQGEQQEQHFWEEWNAYITELIRIEMDQPDPWEGMNRKVFAFNDFADRYALTPVAKGYQWVTPDPVERGVSNVFANLLEITTVVNDLLQFKFAQAASDTGRFVINSTVGLAGIFDVATPIGLEKNNEDFGQTLGYWGVGPGPYIVVPFFGSYTVRDGFGAIVDTTSDYVTSLDHVPTRNVLWMSRNIDDRASLFAAEQLITGDRYAFIRDAYLQRRQFLVSDGLLEDSFGDESYEDEDDWGDDWDEELDEDLEE